MQQNFKEHIINLLLQDDRLKDEQGELRGNLVKEYVNTLDEKLITLLLEDEQTRTKFFLKIKDVYVFKTNEFKFFLDENSIDNSFTQYSNRIGLASGGKFLKDNTDVVLNFPFKDCVLEGGQSTEDGLDTYFEYDEKQEDYIQKQSKRKEIFFNEVLARDEIDRLLEPKAFNNITKYDSKGKSTPKKFNRNAKGTITDNLIIKGNNLLALHSLKKEFKGKIKLIYIDPPYNTGNDSFAYNDNFNHSTWLTFMRNRLMVAKELLREDGVIFVQCDDNEQAYLKILMDSVFYKKNYLQTVSVKKATTAGFKSINLCPITTKEYIFIYGKFYNNNKSILNKIFVKAKHISDYNTYISNISENYKNWNFISLNDLFYKSIKVPDWKNAKKKLGLNWKNDRDIFISDFSNKNYEGIVSFKDLHKPSAKVQEIMRLSKINRDIVYELKRDGESMFFKKGRSITFYKNKFRKIDNILMPTEVLSDVWTDVKWDGIANEGGITMKNGKKPEKLLKRIIELATKEGDIILDYHFGSGTTGSVAKKMRRQYIGCEQIDAQTALCLSRLNNVIEGEQGGISKFVNWQGGGSFIYLELAKNNQTAKEEIQKCKSLEELMQYFETMYQKYFLHYNVRIKQFKEEISKEENFKKLTLNRQKEIFSKMLDLNQLYVNLSEIEDSKYNISKEDIALTKDFYQVK